MCPPTLGSKVVWVMGAAQHVVLPRLEVTEAFHERRERSVDRCLYDNFSADDRVVD